MQHKNIAIWVLSFALLGAVSEVPGFFLNQVLGGMIAAAFCAFVICCLVSYKKNRKVSALRSSYTNPGSTGPTGVRGPYAH